MAIALAAFGEGAVVGVVMLSVEHSAASAVLGHPFPLQIGQVSGERRSPPPMPHHTRLDGNATRPVIHKPGGSDARGSAATETAAPDAAPGPRVKAARLLGGRKRPGEERLGAASAGAPPVADTAKPDVQIVVASHGAGAREVRVVVK